MKISYLDEYKVLTSVKSRCYNANRPNYQWYGGRGVRICDRWLGPNGFDNFYSDMGPRPSPRHQLDKDIKGGIGCTLYSPDTCTWALPSEHSKFRNHRNMMTEDEIQTIKKLYEKGLSIREISKVVDRSVGAIRINLGDKFKSQAMNEYDHLCIKKLYYNGMRIISIMEYTGRSHTSVRKALSM